ncbi:tetratricopeptide repeat protein [uncultured Novosphingobium sp.]|uniref:tetratricopeptide repeat protein n=1 Tax=uncultured Novosphingobium sp. TaxID=292277 RepID=UPI00258A2260|nr:tetratricopeptide repeat protein [uncultured Novosphingobium sp.]
MTPVEAASHLGITPELLTAYTRAGFRKGAMEPRPLATVAGRGPLRFHVEELDAFDRHLQEPWALPGDPRPDIPQAIVAHLKAETRNQCAWCGGGSRVETAHIEPWSVSWSHYHHNLIRLCSTCHGRHDNDGSITTAELRQRKDELVAATRATLCAGMDDLTSRVSAPRPAARFFGRTEEVDRLVADLDRGASVMISGPGGIGKTELLLQALTRAAPERRTIWLEVERYATAQDFMEALLIALSIAGEPCTTAKVHDRLDQINARVVVDGIERGSLDDLDALEDALHGLHAGTRRTQFVTTTQVNLQRVPADARYALGALDAESSVALVREGWDARLFAEGDDLDGVLALCQGHALTLRLAGAIASHYGGVGGCLRVIRERGTAAVALPARRRQDHRSSLDLCLAVAFESLTEPARKALWLLAQAPAGLFAREFEREDYRIVDPIDALAELRRWNLVYTTGADLRERMQCLSPIRIFAAGRWAPDNVDEAARLKGELLESIAIMVSVIGERSEDAENIGYMVGRISEEMPNVRFMIAEAAAHPENEKFGIMACMACSSLVRYFFVLRLAHEGAEVMSTAAEISFAAGRVNEAAEFVTTLIGLARRAEGKVVTQVKRLIARVEAHRPLLQGTEGDLLIAKTMIALDAGDPELAARLSREAFDRFKAAGKEVTERRPDDPDPLDEDIIAARHESLHNDIAAALKLHGDAQLALRDFEKAAEAYRHSLRHERGGSVPVNLGQTLHQIGNCESNLGNHLEAAEYYAKALTVFLMVGMREFTSNAAGELGYALFDCDLPSVRSADGDGIQACFDDLDFEFASCLAAKPVDVQRALGLTRKTFGTIALAIFAGQADIAADWSFRTATERLVPLAEGAAVEDDRFVLTMLDTPLRLAFMVGDLEDSRDGNGDPEIGLVRGLLQLCCSVDPWSRDMFRLADWLTVYLTRCLGVVDLTRDRVRGFMANFDADVPDELDLHRPRPAPPPGDGAPTNG